MVGLTPGAVMASPHPWANEHFAMRHLTMANRRDGSKCEILALSLCFPLLLQKRTQVGHAVTSGKCQKPTFAVYSITSSASAIILLGISRLSALAVFRLMIRSNLVGCRTGSSAGLAPSESGRCRRRLG